MTDRFRDLIENDRLVDILYKTDPPTETVSPRVTYDNAGVPHVYCMKETIPLSVFMERHARGEQGMWLAAYRPSNGRQTTITFAKQDRLTFGKRFIDAVAAERTRLLGPAQDFDGHPTTPDSVDSEKRADIRVGAAKKISLEELERKLALQREIGRLGEDAAYRYEYVRLDSLGCPNPAEHIERVSETDVGAGYDMRSTFAGETRYIEVKASTTRLDSFYISENERDTLTELGQEAFIYLCCVDRDTPKNSVVVREIADPMNPATGIQLEAVAYRAKLGE
ncbi:DUF3883 domain-containing protein [Ralstonia sp. SET104]|uniref:DUF3883 domain-containing protein n=1 Tax=Ralstonia sp. SET104 TaxID=2448774 RepID=UPI000F55B777|nr:DUF3883 domain-containing protein [Ralstonia sp. SET104]GCB02611.1 hypothetical protein PSUB009319_02420 [Ralstonia sp. SET104]